MKFIAIIVVVAIIALAFLIYKLIDKYSSASKKKITYLSDQLTLTRKQLEVAKTELRVLSSNSIPDVSTSASMALDQMVWLQQQYEEKEITK